MNDIFQRLIEDARHNLIDSAARAYSLLTGEPLQVSKEIMKTIRKQTNWERKDKQNAEDGSEHSSSS